MNGPAEPARALRIPDGGQRDDLAEFVGRVVQLDAGALIRLCRIGDVVVAWASTPFGVLATRAVSGELAPAEVTVSAGELLAALAVARSARIDPGQAADARWRADLPPTGEWRTVGAASSGELAERAEAGIAEARGVAVAHGSGAPVPPPELLDRVACKVADTAIPLRVLFALSGLGYLTAGDTEPVRVAVSADGGWLRLEMTGCAVVRRRRVLLPLV